MHSLRLSLAVLSCDVVSDFQFSGKLNRTLYYSAEFEGLDSFEAIGEYVFNRVNYDDVRDDIKYWNNPKETLDLGYETCADYALLFLNIAYYSLGLKGELILSDADFVGRSIEIGGKVNHAVIRFCNIYVEPQSGCIIEVTKVGYSYTFDHVF